MHFTKQLPRGYPSVTWQSGRPPLTAIRSVRETRGVGDRELGRVRSIALALPGVSEQLSHGAPCFFVPGNRALCYYHDHHHGDDRISLWCPAPPGVPEELVSPEPRRFFRPPTSAPPGESSVVTTED